MNEWWNGFKYEWCQDEVWSDDEGWSVSGVNAKWREEEMKASDGKAKNMELITQNKSNKDPKSWRCG